MKYGTQISIALIVAGLASIGYAAWGIGAGASVDATLVGLIASGLGMPAGGLYVASRSGSETITNDLDYDTLYRLLNTFRANAAIDKDTYDQVLSEVGDALNTD